MANMVGMEPEHEESDTETIARHVARRNFQMAEEWARKRAALEAEYRSKRLEIAAPIFIANQCNEEGWALAMADSLMAANASAPIPDGAIL